MAGQPIWITMQELMARRAPPPRDRRRRVPKFDPPESLSPELADGFEAAGQTFHIAYVDAAGDESFRLISVRSVKWSSSGQPMLGAYCHERRAYREFRCDRIEYCADLEGEIHDTREFLIENVGLDADQALDRERVDRIRLSTMMELTRRHIVLLAALSRCDHYMHPAEAAIALSHCEHMCERLRPTIEECDMLGRRFARLRPDEEHVGRVLCEVVEEPHADKVRFLRAACDLVAADGVVDPNERKLLNEFGRELVGLELA